VPALLGASAPAALRYQPKMRPGLTTVSATTVAGSALVTGAFWLSSLAMSPVPLVVISFVGFALGRRFGVVGVAQSVLAFYLGLTLLVVIQSRPTFTPSDSDIWNPTAYFYLLIFTAPIAVGALLPAVIGMFVRRHARQRKAGA